jgi:glycerol-3-phosphate O-acyltransferase
MKRMRELLSEGGRSVYIAPSGGRDRPDENGVFSPDPFDPPSLEMTLLQVKQIHRPTHFYSLALLTHSLLPPPHKVRKELGERREVAYSPVHLAVGDEIDIEHFVGCDHPDKKERRKARAHHIFTKVYNDYCRLETIDSAYKQRIEELSCRSAQKSN